MASVLVWSRDDAARYLGDASGYPAADLLVSHQVVRNAFEVAIEGHESCGCERQRRITRARDILVGDGLQVTDAQGRLL